MKNLSKVVVLIGNVEGVFNIVYFGISTIVEGKIDIIGWIVVVVEIEIDSIVVVIIIVVSVIVEDISKIVVGKWGNFPIYGVVSTFSCSKNTNMFYIIYYRRKKYPSQFFTDSYVSLLYLFNIPNRLISIYIF